MSEDEDIADFTQFSNYKYINNPVITYYQEKYDVQINKLKENLLLLNVKDINYLTTCVQLDKIKKLYKYKNLLKKLFLHISIYKCLVKKEVINWIPNFVSLYPIKTMGDGNCLCHAVLIYLIGSHDNAQILRTALHSYMNGEYSNELKERYFISRKSADLANNIETDDKLLNQEWNEIQNMGKLVDTNDTNNKKVDTMTFLEDIHIFGLANLLKRTIIIIALEKIRDIQSISMRGVYMPILNSSNECVKEPILIAFHNFHFCPLLYAVNEYDDDSLSVNLNDILNMDETTEDETDMGGVVIENKNKIKNTERTLTYSFFPLVYHDYESMKIHFLMPKEEKNTVKYLKEYLQIVEMPVEQLDDDTDQLVVLGCKIGTNRKTSYNGLNTYFDYLNTRLGTDYVSQTRTEPLSAPVTPPPPSQPVKSLITKAIFSPSATISSSSPSRYAKSESSVGMKCKHTNCMMEVYDNYTDYCELHKDTKLKSEKYGLNLCKTSGCSSYSLKIYDDYCVDCYNRKNPIKTCKKIGCHHFGISTYNGYCKNCNTNKYGKCKGENCKQIVDRNVNSGYCSKCHWIEMNSNQYKCLSTNCDGIGEDKLDGFCKSCYEILNRVKIRSSSGMSTLSSAYNRCRNENCSELAKSNGYCESCFIKRYNTCKSRTCTNEAKYDGLCAKCFAQLNLTSDFTLPMSTNKNDMGVCKGLNCMTIIPNSEMYCKKCLFESKTKNFIKNKDDIEIPIRIEKTVQKLPFQNTASFTTPRLNINTTTYRRDFKAPTQLMEQSSINNNKVCINCNGYLPRHHINEGMCGRCLTASYIKHGQHFKSNGIFNATQQY